ncbi:hypothetical protein lerEdw1_017717 [Lerista edwardsae]|nr:hypothetical protein lerEdw1_017717 [Lerista edwardsae]
MDLSHCREQPEPTVLHYVIFKKKIFPEVRDILTDGNSNTSHEMENIDNGEDTKEYHLTNGGRREGKVEIVEINN